MYTPHISHLNFWKKYRRRTIAAIIQKHKNWSYKQQYLLKKPPKKIKTVASTREDEGMVQKRPQGRSQIKLGQLSLFSLNNLK